MNKKISRIVSCLIIGGLLLTTGSAVLANSNPQKQPGTPGFPGPGQSNVTRLDSLKEVLNNLVNSSGITREQADQLLDLEKEKEAQIKAKREENRNRTPGECQNPDCKYPNSRACIFSDAVDQGIITEDEQATISKAMAEANQKQRQTELQNRLEQLVSQKIISQEQANAIMAQIQKAATEQKADMEKIRNMSVEERQQYMQNKNKRADLLDELVADGTLTKAQAYDVAKIMGRGFHNRPMGHSGMGRPNEI